MFCCGEKWVREGGWGVWVYVFALYKVVIRKSLTEMMTFKQKPKGSEGASQLGYLGKERSRQREQPVQKLGDRKQTWKAARPEWLEENGGKGTGRRWQSHVWWCRPLLKTLAFALSEVGRLWGVLRRLWNNVIWLSEEEGFILLKLMVRGQE